MFLFKFLFFEFFPSLLSARVFVLIILTRSRVNRERERERENT